MHEGPPLGLLKLYPGAIALATIDIEELCLKVVELSNGHYGVKTAQKLHELAKSSTSSGIANAGRAKGLVILCDQLLHTQANLDELESELDALLSQDEAAKKLDEIPQFGPKTIAGLRAELGEVERFSNCNGVVAYAGLDLTVKESAGTHWWVGKVR